MRDMLTYVCMRMCVYVRTHWKEGKKVPVCLYMLVFVCMFVSVCVCISVFVCMHAGQWIDLYVHVSVLVCLCVHL